MTNKIKMRVHVNSLGTTYLRVAKIDAKVLKLRNGDIVEGDVILLEV
jgi:hypothetical protein